VHLSHLFFSFAKAGLLRINLLEKVIKNQFLWSSFLFERKVAGKQHRKDFNPLAD
jgi:hypothetical protein